MSRRYVCRGRIGFAGHRNSHSRSGRRNGTNSCNRTDTNTRYRKTTGRGACRSGCACRACTGRCCTCSTRTCACCAYTTGANDACSRTSTRTSTSTCASPSACSRTSATTGTNCCTTCAGTCTSRLTKCHRRHKRDEAENHCDQPNNIHQLFHFTFLP